MDDGTPRYSFDPLEKRGVLLGLHGTQIVVAGVGAGVAWTCARNIGGSAGIAIAVVIAIGAAAGSIWTKEGLTAPEWAAISTRWLLARTRGPVLSDVPERGLPYAGTGRPSSAPPASRVRARCNRGSELEDIGIHELRPEVGADPLAVVIDKTARSWAAVLPVTGGSFALLDPSDQARRLELWRVTLNAVARPGTSVRTIQWIESSAFGIPHQVVVVVTVPGPHNPNGLSARKSADSIRRETRLLLGQLRNSDLRCDGPLDSTGIARVVDAAHAVDPTSGGPVNTRHCWPIAEEEQWSVCRMGGTWHATYWVAEWPRIEVGPDFLAPLIMSGERRTVSMTMAPVPTDRAAREARSARTADVADEHLRSKAGFLPSPRRDREADGPARREIELADGHAEYRFSGYVRVTAPSRSELDDACAQSEHAAFACHLDIRRLYGRQRQAFTWTLPFGRGLRAGA